VSPCKSSKGPKILAPSFWFGCEPDAAFTSIRYHRLRKRTIVRAATERSSDCNLGWSTPRVRHLEQADRWSWLIVAVYVRLRLA
jgi:hypothetical protein